MQKENDVLFTVRHQKQHVMDLFCRLLKTLAIVGQAIIFISFWVLYYSTKMQTCYLWRGNLAIAVLYAVILLFFFRIYGGFRVGNLVRMELFLSQVLSQFITNTIFYILSILLCEQLLNPLPLIGSQLTEMLFIYLWILLFESVDRRYVQRQRLAVFYRNDEDIARVSHIKSFLRRYSVVEKAQISVGAEAMIDIGSFEIDAVLLVGIDATIRNDIIKECTRNNISVFILPKISDILLQSAEMELFSGEILFHSGKAAPLPEYVFIKRTFDIIASLCALIVTSPIILLTSLAVKIEDGGPIFYRQIRLTKNGKRFYIFKFRSMHIDAEKDGKARLSTAGDDRITKVGRFIRACRIDEIPQLVNILLGDMTIVGPRPERPEIAEQYEKELPEFALRLQVKAGLTGYAQIYGRYNSEPYEKLLMDLVYINKMSVIEDLRLMIATVRVLFSKESTEGVGKGQITAMSIENG